MSKKRNAVTDIWGARTPYRGEGAWPSRLDQRQNEEPERWIQSACVLCSNGCALDIGVRAGRIVGVRGREVDAVNRGRLGPKGLFGWEANNSADRLTTPLIRRNGTLQPASWDEAMDEIVRRTRQIRQESTAGALAFYTSGQLMLEEYYTLGVIGKAGLGTPHMDGNTRLCTATAAAALKESFGADGQPAGYADIDETDCLLLVGHNMAATATVLWSRVLDRRAGPHPPHLVVIDPRRTATAEEADVHLAPRIGSNMAVLNGLLNLLIERGWTDRAFIEAHTLGFEELRAVVAKYPPVVVEELSGVPAADLVRAAELIGKAPSLVSTCLQGVYQSMQATAAAVQVNNINLIRGLIGRPGSGVLQMNGQPTAQNNRECGADGDLPGFRNWNNRRHIEELARLWNVDPAIIPHWAPPTHALEIFHLAAQGSIRMLWIAGTNPAVSMPDLGRVRAILDNPALFVVVQDAFMTETVALADIVLPVALWGERTGTFTNADRTVHIAHKAVEPPGQARSDLDIWLDFARRMDFRDKDDQPLIKWSTAEEAFEAWKECTRGRPCDYTGLSYARLSGGSGISWPCTEGQPAGTPRLYADWHFATDPDYCETYGHDLQTGADVSEQQYRALNPAGRALLKALHYEPPHERPDGAYPFMLTTGRVVHHFHTRTKTGRVPALVAAAPEPYIQMSEADARRLGLVEGELVRVASRRGAAEAPLRIGGISAGELFMPFHYGDWDRPGRHAANELTLYEWDPVSKQPHFKYAAVSAEKASGTQRPRVEKTTVTRARSPRPHAHVADYLAFLIEAENALADAFERVRDKHAGAPDIRAECTLFAGWSRSGAARLAAFVPRYGKAERLQPHAAWSIDAAAPGGFGLMRDLHALWTLAQENFMSIAMLLQSSRATHDKDLEQALLDLKAKNERQGHWLLGRVDQSAPQALVVPV